MAEEEAVFRNRADAGRRLAGLLEPWRRAGPVVLGLPRGGVPVAAEAARRLAAPLDVLLVRKLGAPGQSELAIGAVTDGPEPVVELNRPVVDELGVTGDYIRAETARQLAELARQAALYRAGRPPLEVGGRCAIVVDDGMATGATMLSALRALDRLGAAERVAAVPVAAAAAAARVRAAGARLVCLSVPEPFAAVSRHYESFDQTTDEEVVSLVRELGRG